MIRFEQCDAREISEKYKGPEVDLILTGPPFFSMSVDMSASGWFNMVTSGLKSAGRLLKDDGVMIVQLGEEGHRGLHRAVINMMCLSNYHIFGEDIWVHGGNMARDKYDPIFLLSKKPRSELYKTVHNFSAPPIASIPISPTEIAVFGTFSHPLAKILIGSFTNEGDLVLDPFCGTGVIPRAAEEIGREGYGSDLHQRIVDYARKNS